MNTLEFDTRLRHRRPIPAEKNERTPPPAAAAGIPVVVLTTDDALRQAIRAAADQQPFAAVGSLEEAIGLAAQGQCGILVTDQALDQPALSRISKQLHTHDPAIVTIAVGSRGDDNALIGLLSSAVVERFMLKPVTPALAKLVLKSAATEYRSLKTRIRSDALLKGHQSPAEVTRQHAEQAPPAIVTTHAASAEARREEHAAPAVVVTRYEPAVVAVAPAPRAHLDAVVATDRKGTVPGLPWLAVAAAVLATAVVAWILYRPAGIDPQQVIATNLKSAQAALAAGNYSDPAESSALHYFSTVLALDPVNVEARQGMQKIADVMAENVKTLIVQGRLAEAGIALERARRIGHDGRRLEILETQLRQEQASQLVMLKSGAAAQVDAAAARAASVAPAKKATPAAVPVTPRSKRVDTGAVADVELADVASPKPAAHTETVLDKPTAMTAAIAPASNANGSAAGGVAVVPPPITAPAPAATTPANKEIAPPVTATASAAGATAHVEPKLVKLVQPEYPADARMRGIEGWVDLTLTVSASGEVADARIESSSRMRMFDRAALAAVHKWRYDPHTLAQGATTQPVHVRVQFKLAN
ncbi:MAG TPA: energy transducer TonB [Povalibacter sp.]|nr:energy transducer TonB [Povalibacter sp.]